MEKKEVMKKMYETIKNHVKSQALMFTLDAVDHNSPGCFGAVNKCFIPSTREPVIFFEGQEPQNMPPWFEKMGDFYFNARARDRLADVAVAVLNESFLSCFSNHLKVSRDFSGVFELGSGGCIVIHPSQLKPLQSDLFTKIPPVDLHDQTEIPPVNKDDLLELESSGIPFIGMGNLVEIRSRGYIGDCKDSKGGAVKIFLNDYLPKNKVVRFYPDNLKLYFNWSFLSGDDGKVNFRGNYSLELLSEISYTGGSTHILSNTF